MKKNLFKAVAGCAAVCLVAGAMIVGGNANDAVAEDNYVINLDFEDGQIPSDEHITAEGCKFEIVDGVSSNAFDGTGSKCLKVTNRTGSGWWENRCFTFNMKDLEPGKKYDIGVDVWHDNGPDENEDEARQFKLATYFSEGYNGDVNYNDLSSEEKAEVTPMYYQIGDIVGIFSGEKWEHIEGTVTIKEDTRGKDYLVRVFMGYNEETQKNGGAFKIENKEDYYMDNFTVKEHVDATEAPSPTATAEPSPTAEVPAPGNDNNGGTPSNGVTPPQTGTTPTEGTAALEAGYEETVGNITYKVIDSASVAVIGGTGKKVNIPATVSIKGQECKVTTIEKAAFQKSKIKSVTIGANVTTIGKSAFAKCSSLKKITIKSTAIKSIGKKAFSGINKKAAVKVPKANKKAYSKLLKKAGLPKKAKVK